MHRLFAVTFEQGDQRLAGVHIEIAPRRQTVSMKLTADFTDAADEEEDFVPVNPDPRHP
jgi:hypothetical protein